MKKQLPLYLLLVFLIIVNGFFLFQYLGKTDRKGPKRTESLIEKRLNFTEIQTDQYRELLSEHRKTMEALDNDIRVFKDTFFNSVSKTDLEISKIDSMASVIATLEKQKDLELFRHFRKVYEICDNKQKENFQGLVKKALRKGRRSRRGKPPRH